MKENSSVMIVSGFLNSNKKAATINQTVHTAVIEITDIVVTQSLKHMTCFKLHIRFTG